jgi:xanthine dehydrogenase accessory factor
MSDWIAPLRSLLVSDGRAVLVTLASVRGSTPRDAGTKMIVTLHATHGTIGGGHLEFDAIRIAREALAGSGAGAWLARFPLAARLGQCCGGVATLLFQRVDRENAQWLHELQRVEDDAPLALASPIAPAAAGPVALTARTIAGSELPPDVLRAVEQVLSQSDPAPALTPDGLWYIERVVRNDFRVLVFGNGHVGRALVQVLGTLPCEVAWIDEREDDFPATVAPNVTRCATPRRAACFS